MAEHSDHRHKHGKDADHERNVPHVALAGLSTLFHLLGEFVDFGRFHGHILIPARPAAMDKVGQTALPAM
jgi:hypothetical protein